MKSIICGSERDTRLVWIVVLLYIYIWKLKKPTNIQVRYKRINMILVLGIPFQYYAAFWITLLIS